MVGDIRGPLPLPGRLLPGGQLAMCGPNDRTLAPGPRAPDAGLAQSCLPLPPAPMNPLLSLEVAALAEGQEWTRRHLETLAQNQVNDWGAICPVSGVLLKYRKRQRLKLTTCAGVITLKTTRGFSSALGRWINPTREHCGLKPRQRISPELQSRLAFNATVTGSYEKAAATAQRWGTRISDDTVHSVV